MKVRELYKIRSNTREDMVVKGYSFGRGDPAACILGAVRGTEIQQLYICSRLVHTLKELEGKGCISAGKEILVVPAVNPFSINTGLRFWGVGDIDLNRSFPGNAGGDTADRIADGVLSQIRDYSYGIQFASFYMPGEFVPHVRMMETGYQSPSLANLFGLPYVVIHKPRPVDTRTLNYNWQNRTTAAFSVYTNTNSRIDEKSAGGAQAAVLRFLTRMGLIRYESHSGYISHVLQDEDLSNVHTGSGGIFRRLADPGEYVRYHQPVARVLDAFEGEVIEEILAPTEGVVFYAHQDPLVCQGDIVFRLIHRLHE